MGRKPRANRFRSLTLRMRYSTTVLTCRRNLWLQPKDEGCIERPLCPAQQALGSSAANVSFEPQADRIQSSLLSTLSKNVLFNNGLPLPFSRTGDRRAVARKAAIPDAGLAKCPTESLEYLTRNHQGWTTGAFPEVPACQGRRDWGVLSFSVPASVFAMERNTNRCKTPRQRVELAKSDLGAVLLRR